MVTVILLSIFLGLTLVGAVLWALFLRFGLHWAKVEGVTGRRLVLTMLYVVVLQVTAEVLVRRVETSTPAGEIALILTGLALMVLIPCFVITAVFGCRLLRSLQAWVPTLLPGIMMILVASYFVRPFLFEAFNTPTNSMAPTLLGNHWRAVCTECGESCYCSPLESRFVASFPTLMICENFHVTERESEDARISSQDRFFVAKFLNPRRWDVVVFQHPAEQAQLHVDRLVGLPGETVHIDDGAIWIDGRRLAPPDSLRGIEYLSALPQIPAELWGTVDRPVTLGADEFFVLGDFSARSADGRTWERGAEGHNPYAVPESHLHGVVTHIHWPPKRWRILR